MSDLPRDEHDLSASDPGSLADLGEFREAARALDDLRSKVAVYGTAADVLTKVSSQLDGIRLALAALPTRLEKVVDGAAASLDKADAIQSALLERARLFESATKRLEEYDFSGPIQALQTTSSSIDNKLNALYHKLDARMAGLEAQGKSQSEQVMSALEKERAEFAGRQKIQEQILSTVQQVARQLAEDQIRVTQQLEHLVREAASLRAEFRTYSSQTLAQRIFGGLGGRRSG